MTYKYFNLQEFASPDEPDSGLHMNREFISLLDKARDIVEGQMIFKITSGYRTENYNDNVLKARIGSSHKLGLAVDIAYNGSRERYLLINSLMSVGINRIGIGKTFIHCDVDSVKDQNVIWTYDY
jgi:uncharacterized protein YcbK (DUF882 family)|tara:strand:+ start:718 stop:1092 length:375 start_codon:yes stop_codon:yes gene_type:complete